MPKSRKRPKQKKKKKDLRKRPKPYQVVKQNLFKVQSPFPVEMPFDEKLKMLQEVGNKANKEFEVDYLKLQNYFKDYDALYLMSFCAYYFLSKEEGIDEEAINGRLEFPPFFIEILQAFSLFHNRAVSGKPLHENVENFKSLLQSLNHNQSFSYFKLSENVTKPEDVGAIMLRTEMMSHTLAVRNWAYVEQMESITYDLSDTILDKFTALHGFSSKTLLDVLFGLVSLTERKINNHLKKTRSFIIAKTYNEVFDLYEENFKEVNKTDNIERIEIWKKFGKSIKSIKAMLLEHSDYFLLDVFTHSVSEIQDFLSYKVSNKDVGKILDSLSYEFGDLSNENKNHIFLSNPIHFKPLIKIDKNKYFSVIVHMFSHLGIEILENFISTDSDIRNEYSSKKGKYLEERVERLFRNSFPNAKILSGSLWNCPITKKDYENDLIVIIEDFAIIVECKSGTISPPARRGATERLFKTLKELVVEPSEQAIRFESFLKANDKVLNFKTKSGKLNEIDCSSIKYYIPLGITLSNLGSIGCNLKKLIEAQIINHKLDQLAPSINFTDLEIVFDILTYESEKIHYLSRRREFEAHIRFQGDEMDLFGFYLDNGFNIGETEYDDSIYLDLTLKSKEIDPYVIGKHRGVNVEKPFLEKTEYWNDILGKLDGKGNKWLMASFILLNLPKEDQFQFEKNVNKLKKMILDKKCQKEHNWMEMICGPKRRQYVIIGYPYQDISKKKRNEVAADIIDKYMGEEYRGVLVLGYDLNSNHYPYSFVAGSLETELFDSLD